MELSGEVAEPPDTAGFGFALVRNPFDRVVSCYHNKVVEQNAGLHADMYHARDFAHFVDLLIRQPHGREQDDHIRPQTLCLDGAALDLIGRWEEIASVGRAVCVAAGRSIELKIVNPSTGRADYRKYYTPELVEKVSQYYVADLEHYDYSF